MSFYRLISLEWSGDFNRGGFSEDEKVKPGPVLTFMIMNYFFACMQCFQSLNMFLSLSRGGREVDTALL